MSKQVKTAPAKSTKQTRRIEARKEQRRREEERLRAQKTRRILFTTIIALVVVAAGIFAFSKFVYHPQGSTGASTNQASQSNTPYAPIDNISCDSQEQLAYHIHIHLSIYVNGSAVQIPQGVGIAGDSSCIYWLHTHDTSGIVHIESPTQHVYTLGNFLDVWSERFPTLPYPVQLGDSSNWKVYVNGKAYSGDLHSIPMNAHTLITLGYNSPNIKPDTSYNWGSL